MEWVETTGRTLEEAKDAALDQLGVDEGDAEFEVVDEGRSGLFGRVRQEARVRARVKPTAPPPKTERRDRRRRSTTDDGGEVSAPDVDATPAPTAATPAPAPARATRRPAARREPERSPERPAVDIDLEASSQRATSFLRGLVAAFGAEGTPVAREVDEETVEVVVDGDDLGLLIGPKGNTLSAVQELTRTVVHRATNGAGARVRVDIGGYNERRRAALQRFTLDVAEKVRTSGSSAALEPMNPADRKVVHDTVNDLDGVSTISEGVEPNRRVVVSPVSA